MADEYELVVVELGRLVAAEGPIASTALDVLDVNALKVALDKTYVRSYPLHERAL